MLSDSIHPTKKATVFNGGTEPCCAFRSFDTPCKKTTVFVGGSEPCCAFRSFDTPYKKITVFLGELEQCNVAFFSFIFAVEEE